MPRAAITVISFLTVFSPAPAQDRSAYQEHINAADVTLECEVETSKARRLLDKAAPDHLRTVTEKGNERAVLYIRRTGETSFDVAGPVGLMRGCVKDENCEDKAKDHEVSSTRSLYVNPQTGRLLVRYQTSFSNHAVSFFDHDGRSFPVLSEYWSYQGYCKPRSYKTLF